MAKKAKPQRAQRKHGRLPAGYTPRPRPDGSIRPRWIPQPKQRELGWKGVNLVDETGAYLSHPLALAKAEAINEAFKAWINGAMVPAEFAAFAPVGSVAHAAPAAVAADMQIGYFVDQWLESREFLAKASGTRRDYKNKLNRLVDAVCGYSELPAIDDAEGRARYKAAVETARAWSIMTLAPSQEPGGELFDPLYEAYWALHRHAGVNMASGVLAVASVWLNWIHARKRREVVNWAKTVSRETPPGRIRPGTVEEIRALVRLGDAHGFEDVVDAAVLSLDLSWSQIDVLLLTDGRVVDYRAQAFGDDGRAKTGRVGGTPMTFLGRQRVDLIRERWKGEKVQSLDTTNRRLIQVKRDKFSTNRGIEADSDRLRKRWAELRALAAKEVPSIATLQFADLRDTAITWQRNAKLSTDEMASRTLQSRQNIQNLHDKHYGEIGEAIADAGRDQLERWMMAEGIKL